MHNRRREAEKNEWMAKALARAAGKKLPYVMMQASQLPQHWSSPAI